MGYFIGWMNYNKCELNPSPIRLIKNILIIDNVLVAAGILALFALKRRQTLYPKMYVAMTA